MRAERVMRALGRPIMIAARCTEEIARDAARRHSDLAPPAVLRHALLQQSRQDSAHATGFAAALAYLGPATAPDRMLQALEQLGARLHADLDAGDLGSSMIGLQYALEGLGSIALQPPPGELARIGDKFLPLREMVLHQEQGHRRLGEVWVPQRWGPSIREPAWRRLAVITPRSLTAWVEAGLTLLADLNTDYAHYERASRAFVTVVRATARRGDNMKKFIRAFARPVANAVAALTLAAAPAVAAPQLEGLSPEEGRVLLERIAVMIQEFIPGKLNVDEIDYISPAPLGRGFYLVSARRGRLMAMTDEQVTNVMWLQEYINLADGNKRDVLAALRQKVAPAAQATPGRTRFVLHPAEAIPLYGGERVVHVLCDPNSRECVRFSNEVLKRTPNIRAYIHPVTLLSPGNWRDSGVRDLLCWPEASRFAQWDRIVNSASAAGVPGLAGQSCTRDGYVDELTSSIRQGGYAPSELPIVTLPNGRSMRAKGMTAQQLDKLLASN